MKKVFIVILALFTTVSYSYGFDIMQNILKKWAHKICKISSVDDWDTFDLECYKSKNTSEFINNVRLLWVNTADIDSDWYKHCYYDTARKAIEKIKNIDFDIEFFWEDLCKDPYKWCRNLIRIISLDNWNDINEKLISKWIWFEWTNFSMIPDEIKTNYKLAEIKAKEENKWLWKKCEIQYNWNQEENSSIPTKMTK